MQRLKKIIAWAVVRLFLSILVVSIPFLYMGFCQLRHQVLPVDKPPFVHWSGLDPHSEVFVTWETSGNTGAFISYGTDPNNLTLRMENNAASTLHRFHLTGLSPNTRYYYQAGPPSAAPPRRPFKVQTFKTAPVDAGEFNVTCISDTQEIFGLGYYSTVGAAIARHPDTSFVINAGDLTQTAEDQALWNLFFHQSPFLDRVPLVPCPGNHDDIDSPDSKYVKYFGFTENNRDVFYSFDWGTTRFIIAQTGNRSHVDPAEPRNAAHFKWLEETLAAGQDKDYRILVCHINRLESMAPLVEKYNVSLVVHGHAHTYSRYTVNGRVYVCLGNGATIQDGSIERAPNVQRKTNGAGITRLTVNQAGIRLETFTPMMDVMDSVFLRRDGNTGVLVPEETKTD